MCVLLLGDKLQEENVKQDDRSAWGGSLGWEDHLSRALKKVRERAPGLPKEAPFGPGRSGRPSPGARVSGGVQGEMTATREGGESPTRRGCWAQWLDPSPFWVRFLRASADGKAALGCRVWGCIPSRRHAWGLTSPPGPLHVAASGVLRAPVAPLTFAPVPGPAP